MRPYWTITERLLANAIEVYPEETIYDTDENGNPTVNFELLATDSLWEIAQWMCCEHNLKPFDRLGEEGTYNFYIGITRICGEIVLDGYMEITHMPYDGGRETSMHLPIGDDEAGTILEILNMQCEEYDGMDLGQLLDEAKEGVARG